MNLVLAIVTISICDNSSCDDSSQWRIKIDATKKEACVNFFYLFRIFKNCPRQLREFFVLMLPTDKSAGMVTPEIKLNCIFKVNHY